MSSSLVISLSLNPPLAHGSSLTLSNKSSFLSISTKSKSLTRRFSSSSALPSNPLDPDEIRWLREEQRWLREEQRWLREEQRWNRERESLILEITELKLKIQALEKNHSIYILAEDTVASVAGLKQVLKEKNLIAAPTPSRNEESDVVKVVDEAAPTRSQNKESDVVKVVDEGVRSKEAAVEKVKRKPLRIGSEGDEVKTLQEALGKLGFYSGEEDMEFSSFSTGTERAVKTWQATIGASEDGIMTSELLEKLYTEQQISEIIINYQEGSPTAPQPGGINGAQVTSVTKISEIKETIVKKDENRNDASQSRVFLLGENRWEDSSRLSGGKKKVVGNKTVTAKTNCATCRGEGRLMCMECDGTGEPNIEPQFMEWVDEGTKCAYCEGLGFITCDVCHGK